MKRLIVLFFTAALLYGCGSSRNTTSTTPAPPPVVQRIPAKFDFSPPSRSQVGSAGITIAIVKPTYVGKNPEYLVPPFDEMAERMGTDFEELLTAKGFTMRGPFGSRDEMVYEAKVNSSFILEIGIELNPQYNRKYTTITHSPSFAELMVNKYATTTYTYKMNGEITLAGNLVIKAKSAQYGELLWTKSIAIEPSSFTYTGQGTWKTVPGMADELKQDNQVYNTVSNELEKMYQRALNLAWQQIDVQEMKVVAEQGKKADKRGS